MPSIDTRAFTRAARSHHPKLLIVTDAWRPQVNGVVRTLEMLGNELRKLGVDVEFLTPEGFSTVGMPTYPEIRLSLTTPGKLSSIIDGIAPDAIHIATEGPLGFLARMVCVRRTYPFTTCYHTKYPEYIAARAPVPLSVSYSFLRRFHGAAAATMVATGAMGAELASRGFQNLVLWRRGIEVEPFLAAARVDLPYPRPIFLSVGRVAVEKNLDAFLRLDLPGTKIVVGDGPERQNLARRFPEAVFLGKRHGAVLATLYASADAFVFPSVTDTYGLVMVEALTAGTPIAAFPVTGPREVLGDSRCGIMSHDLRQAALEALQIPRQNCRAYGAQHTMRASALSFLGNMAHALHMPELMPFDAAGPSGGKPSLVAAE